MLHQWLFDCAYELGKVYRLEVTEPEEIYRRIRSARVSWRGYCDAKELTIPECNSPAGKARAVVCRALDAAYVKVERARQMAEDVDKAGLCVDVTDALGALFEYMGAMIGAA